jgi:DNA polymerase elongation subunit (family B)
MLGIKIDRSPGVVNLAMTGIMNIIAKIKQELKDAETKSEKTELQRLKMMYQSMKGARNAGTHGILSAPLVSGRQFNLWGAAAITTKGQMILSDTLNYLKDREIRVVYGDTDGIYLGCSRSALNIPEFSKSLGLSHDQDVKKWITKPDIAISAIQQCNLKWQKDLNYPGFELEAETHDAMIFVKHKNYLIFDNKDGKVEMITKGNNFKGSDKANIARQVLEKIMMSVLKENASWESEEEARKEIKNSIIEKTKEALLKLDLSQVDLDDLTLVQSVQPAKRYKRNQDGSISTFGRRAEALERLIEQPIKTRIKLKFVVTKRPLPGIPKPSKSGVKPIDYMYPVDRLKNTSEIDLGWYKKMIENYVQGAFGISDIAVTEQTGLDAWM